MALPFLKYMGTTVKDMLDRVRAFNKTKALGEAMTDNEQEVLDINREQLYDKGIGKDGNPLPPYTPQYAKRKPSRGVVDLYRTGKLHEAMKLQVEGEQYDISSEVSYSPYVLQRRPTSYGLTTEGKRSAWYVVRSGFINKLKEVTGLK